MVTPVPISFDPLARIGTVVAGKYRLERLLGAGGMGAVYEAVHTGVQRRFAVKVMTMDTTRSPEAVRRFTQEAQAAGLIGHPHIVEVFDLGEGSDGTLYMVMELLRGETLHEVLRRGSLSQSDAVSVALELLHALDAAHRAGIVHRDVKPQNLFLADHATGGASLKVLDFGIAKFHEPDASTITRSGAIIGTPLYMAPEQVLSDREIDGRADVWAAGATLFEMLTGRPVHLAPNAAAAAVRIVTETPARVRSLRGDVHPDLDRVVARALSIAREERFQSAAEMIEALDEVRPHLPAEASPLVSPSRSAQPRLPSSGALRATPTAVVASESPSKATASSSRRSALVLFGALALAGGAIAGSLLLPVGSVPPVKVTGSAPTPTLMPMPSPTPAAAPTTPAPTATLDDVPPLPPSPSTPASAPAVPSVAVVVKKPIVRPATSATPLASSSSSSSSPPGAAARCGEREEFKNGHCCPIGMVWQNDHCDRPVATSF